MRRDFREGYPGWCYRPFSHLHLLFQTESNSDNNRSSNEAAQEDEQIP